MKLKQYVVVIPGDTERAEQRITMFGVNVAHVLSQVWDQWRAVVGSNRVPKFVARARVEEITPASQLHPACVSSKEEQPV
jgi:predicted SpoU family rRNA methylase